MYNQEMYWIIEYISENNLEKKKWELVIEQAQNKYIKEIARSNQEMLGKWKKRKRERERGKDNFD